MRVSELSSFLSQAVTNTKGHNDNGYAVYIGMDTNTGDLVVLYEWVLKCRQTKNDTFRRQKQVCLFVCVYTCSHVVHIYTHILTCVIVV